jgi:DHA1 family tetracycline resistance protein-like MFS transporter
MHYSLSTRAILLGALIAMFPLAQFFGAPMLGGYADHYGRKKVLMLSIFGTVIGYLIFIAGILTHDIFLLFAGRLLDGFTGGNVSIALAAAADESDEKEKATNFGLTGVAIGLGLILGPVIGGRLAENTMIAGFTYATPFLFAAILSCINVLLVMAFFKETVHHRIKTKITAWSGFANIKKAWELKNLRTLFIVTFFIAFGFNFFVQFFQVFLIQRFDFTETQIGNFFAYGGLWIAISQGLITPLMVRKFKNSQILNIALFLLAMSFPVLLLPEKVTMLYIVLPFVAVFYGLTQPTSMALVSNLSDEDSQGEILGINQSIQSLAQAIPPIVAGVIVSLNAELPTLVGACATFVAWLVFAKAFQKDRDEKRFSEV